MAGGLFDPLGVDRDDPARPAGRTSAAAVAAALAAGALAGLVALSWLRDTGDRGRPVAVAPIEHVAAPAKPIPPVAAPPPATVAPPAPPPVAPTGLAPPGDDQEVEIQNGVRIVRPRRGPSAKGGQTVTVPAPTPPR